MCDVAYRPSGAEVRRAAKMADEEQLRRLQADVALWNTWRASDPGVEIELSGADLSRSDLRGRDLSKVNLIGANLRGADLSSASLIGANLSGATLRGTDLSGA